MFGTGVISIKIVYPGSKVVISVGDTQLFLVLSGNILLLPLFVLVRKVSVSGKKTSITETKLGN